MQKIKVVHECDCDDFETEVNKLTSIGWVISSTGTCAAINSAEYDYTPSFTAILIKCDLEE